VNVIVIAFASTVALATVAPVGSTRSALLPVARCSEKVSTIGPEYGDGTVAPEAGDELTSSECADTSPGTSRTATDAATTNAVRRPKP
jgi:hypothetical protein